LTVGGASTSIAKIGQKKARRLAGFHFLAITFSS